MDVCAYSIPEIEVHRLKGCDLMTHRQRPEREISDVAPHIEHPKKRKMLYLSY
jgi:hypothetical protein